MKTTGKVLLIILAFSFWKCGEKKYEESASDSTVVSSESDINYNGKSSNSNETLPVSSTASTDNQNTKGRKFVRTAELKFKVKSVINATYNIENITNNLGGFVTYTNLSSNIENSFSTQISEDSSIKTIQYTVTNDITIRVPNTKLDTILKAISKNIDYLDYRIIKADDVALDILANNLTQKRADKHESRLENAIDNRGKKLRETTEAEEVLASKQEAADNAKIANLSLLD